MKINTQELRALYQSEISGNKPLSRRGCPSPGRIAALFGTSISKRRRTKVTDHIVECGRCTEEFESWRELFQQKESMIEELCSWAVRRKTAPDRKHVEDSRALYVPPRPGADTSPRRRLWPYALAASAFLLGLLLILVPNSVFRNNRQIAYRAPSFKKIELIHPRSGKSIRRDALFFQWTPLAGADCYVLEVFNEALAPVWKSPELIPTRILIPPEIRDKWQGSNPYFWLVTAVLADGKRIESDIGIFFIK